MIPFEAFRGGTSRIAALLAALALGLLAGPATATAQAAQGYAADPGHAGVVDGRIGTRPRTLWQADVGIQGYYNSPLAVGPHLVVSSYGDAWNTPDAADGVYVLARADGRVLYHLPTGTDANGVNCDGVRIWAVTDDGKVHAWELATGRALWEVNPFVVADQAPVDQLSPRDAFDLGYKRGHAAGHADALRSLGYVDDSAETTPRLYGAPLLTPQGLVVAGAGGVVRVLDPLTGAVRSGLEGQGRVRNHSAADGLIAFGNTAGEVEVWGADGQLRYRWCTDGEGGCESGPSPYGGQWVYAAPAISRGRIAVAGPFYSAEQFALLDAATGRTLWSFSSTTETNVWLGSAKSSPALTDKLVLFADTVYGSDGRLMAHSIATGQRRWTVDGYGGSWASPVVVGDKVVWATVSGHVLIIGLSSGKVLADVETGDKLFATPAVADGVIYVGGDSGQLYAIDSGFRR
jgi:outer membrane protein assembly factor BamB